MSRLPSALILPLCMSVSETDAGERARLVGGEPEDHDLAGKLANASRRYVTPSLS